MATKRIDLLKKGMLVRLPADKKNDLPEEKGIYQKSKGEFAIVKITESPDKKAIGTLTEIHLNDVRSIENKSINKTNKVMAKTAKKSIAKTAKKSNVKSAKTAKKSTVNRSAVNREGLTRKEASEKLKISIYAVDQLLLKGKLKGLKEEQVMAYKKSAKV